MSEYYDKYNNPFKLNNPKRWDYEKLYDAFFKMQSKLIELEKEPVEVPEAKIVDDERVLELEKELLLKRGDFNDAITLIMGAYEAIVDMENGMPLMCDGSLSQPYRAFLEVHKPAGVTINEVTKAQYLNRQTGRGELFVKSPSKNVALRAPAEEHNRWLETLGETEELVEGLMGELTEEQIMRILRNTESM